MKPISVINATIKRDKNTNKRLVKILNSKMFKGYRLTKESKKDNHKLIKYINNESKTLDPFDDYYNIEYKRKNLSSLYSQDFSNLLQINKINKIPKITTKKREIVKKLSVPIQKGEFFRNIRSIKLTKKPSNKDSYFYFNSNSQFFKSNSMNNKEKKDTLYNTIFQDNNEKGIYNDIPIFAIEKIHRVSNIKNKKILKHIRSKEERINDLQFLYRVSHEKPMKKVDFRNKYNIKSAKINIMKNDMIRNNSQYIRLNTNFKNQHKLNYSQSSYLIPDFTIVNYSFNLDNINNEFQRNYSTISRKKLFYDKATQKRDNLRYSSSAGDLNINQSKLLNKDNKNKKQNRPRSSIFPMERRIISDKIIKDQIDFKKWKFYKLKTLMN